MESEHQPKPEKGKQPFWRRFKDKIARTKVENEENETQGTIAPSSKDISFPEQSDSGVLPDTATEEKEKLELYRKLLEIYNSGLPKESSNEPQNPTPTTSRETDGEFEPSEKELGKIDRKIKQFLEKAEEERKEIYQKHRRDVEVWKQKYLGVDELSDISLQNSKKEIARMVLELLPLGSQIEDLISFIEGRKGKVILNRYPMDSFERRWRKISAVGDLMLSFIGGLPIPTRLWDAVGDGVRYRLKKRYGILTEEGKPETKESQDES